MPGAEGETYRGIVLFPDDPQRRAYLYFDDEKTLGGLSTVRIRDPGSQWSLENGLRVGMLLKDVVAVNGKPIKFHGLDWDYGGIVTSLEGGKLARRCRGFFEFQLAVARRFGSARRERLPHGRTRILE